jgi:hypothetical protein
VARAIGATEELRKGSRDLQFVIDARRAAAAAGAAAASS